MLVKEKPLEGVTFEPVEDRSTLEWKLHIQGPVSGGEPSTHCWLSLFLALSLSPLHLSPPLSLCQPTLLLLTPG